MIHLKDRVASFLGATESNVGLLVLIHINIVFYALCYWIQQPVLPFLSKELGANAVGFGTLQSTVSALALIGGPALGRITDTRGAKTALIIAQSASAIMYGIMALSSSLPLLFISRIPAVAQHAMLCSQAAVAVLTDPQNRASAMGKLSLSYGVGMVIGSPLGGYLSIHLGYNGAAAIASSLSIGIVLLDIAFLPSLTGGAGEKKKSLNFGEVIRVLGVKPVRDILIIMTLTALGISSYRTMFPLAAVDEFGFRSEDLGLFMSFAGIVGLITNIFVVGRATDYLGNYYSVLVSTVSLSVLYVLYALVTDYMQLLVLTVPSSMASNLLYTVGSSLLSMSVDAESAGTAIAMSHASRSFCGIVAPIIGGYIYGQHQMLGLGLFAASTAGAAALFVVAFAKGTFVKLDNITNEKGKSE